MAAITVPIIKDGYRLYPGMPVNGGNGAGRNGAKNSVGGQKTTKGLPISSQGRLSPPDSISTSGSPPKYGNGSNRGAQHQILLQPRLRTSSNQSQISARSSFDVGPTTVRTDLIRGRSAMSTSQLYMQQRRELAIQQQLRRQELAKKQLQQQQQQSGGKSRKSTSPIPLSLPAPPLAQRSDSNGNDSAITDYDAEDSLDFCYGRGRSRTNSTGDHNNNKESSGTNPLRKLLKRLGLGSQNSPNRSETNSISECSIEQAVPAIQCHSLQSAVTARQ